MPSQSALIVLIAPLAYFSVALASLAQPGRRIGALLGFTRTVTWVSLLVSLVAAGLAIAHRTLVSPTLGIAGLGLSVRIDALSVIMFVMISLLAMVIMRYSATYLEGDARHGLFIGRLAATIACVQLLVLAGNLGLLVTAWIATSLALHTLLRFYHHRRGAIIAARKKFILARIGDICLIACVFLLYRQFGTGDLGALFSALRAEPHAGPAVEVAAVLLALAALLKSAQFPTHGWLVEVMETPTPVSALLHAGILNAGPFLAIRMAFLVDHVTVAPVLLIVCGGITALFASVVLLTQPSVKVALGYSSAAHMGFMLMVCGLGVFPAALLHLVAHSFYKAHAFLSSGSVIDQARASKVPLPTRLGHPARIVASFLIAMAIYGLFAAAWGIDPLHQPALLIVGAILVMGLTQIIAPALDSTGPLKGAIIAGGLAIAVATAFFTLEASTHILLHHILPAAHAPYTLTLVASFIVLALFAAAVGFQLFQPAISPSPTFRRLTFHLRHALYANALFDRLVGSLNVVRVRS